jgi:MYXO-CTERM domain-containing protein
LYWPSTALGKPNASAIAGSGDPAPSSPYVIGGLVLSAVLLALYGALRTMRRREWPDLSHIFKIVVATTALTAGARLMVVAITADDLGPFESQDRVFIPLAGLALILISSKEIYVVMQEGCRRVAAQATTTAVEVVPLAKD